MTEKKIAGGNPGAEAIIPEILSFRRAENLFFARDTSNQIKAFQSSGSKGKSV